MAIDRIPVYLLTGFLGSGKTTLLSRWLSHPALRDAAVVVNEIGEVGFDDQVLATATDTATLIGNACVCCTGLPGLEEALEDLFWARLQHRMQPFGSVVIETTGLADPAPVIASLNQVPLLRERYRLAGVITTVGAVGGAAVLKAHAEARSQVACADLLVLTKADLVAPQAVTALERLLREHDAKSSIETSAAGALGWDVVAAHLSAGRTPDPGRQQAYEGPDQAGEPGNQSHVDQHSTSIKIDRTQKYNRSINESGQDDRHAEEHASHPNVAQPHDHGAHEHHHHDDSADGTAGGHAAHAHPPGALHAHDAITSFIVIDDLPDLPRLRARLVKLTADLGDTLLRIKGWVRLDDDSVVSVQMSPAETDIEITLTVDPMSKDSGRRSGLTLITQGSQRRAALILNADW